jgi:single-stranded-DNA-specific exonuclease
MINKYLGWVTEKPERMKELENIYVVNGEGFIDDKVMGAISSILSMSLPNSEKPLIAYTNADDEEELAKVSARTVDAVIHKGVNLGEIMQTAAEKYSGRGGGHNIAAGAQVPMENIDAFINIVNESVRKQLTGKKIAS